jgi:hypothetical protein
MLSSPHAAFVTQLESGCASGRPPALDQATPHQWAAACHELWEAGRIDVVEYGARLLHPAYPDLSYLASLVAFFDAMPRDPPPALDFREDPAAEIQVVRRPDCDAVLMCFCACQGTLGLPISFIHQWVGRLPASLVYIKDFRNLAGGCGFPTLGPDRVASVAALRRIANQLAGRRIFTLGVSMGGYAAMYYGLQLQAVAVLNLAGATDFSPDFVDSLGQVPEDYLTLRRIAPDYARNLRDLYAAAKHRPRVMISYSAGHPRDRAQAERMAGLPNVELMPSDFGQHNVLDPLIRERQFMPLLRRFLSTEPTVLPNDWHHLIADFFSRITKYRLRT